MIRILDDSTGLHEAFIGLIEAIPDAIFLKDGQGRWLVTNETAKSLFKLHDIAWLGKTDQELGVMHPEMRAIHEQCLQTMRLPGAQAVCSYVRSQT